jgi:hypothetical protein
MANKLPKYKISINDNLAEDGEELGVTMIAYTKTPAIITKGVAFSQVPKQMKFEDKLKLQLAAPAMIPNFPIYREDDELGAYEVEFDEETILEIVTKFKKTIKDNQFNLDHNSSLKAPSYILFDWIVEDPETDLSFVKYGVKVPKGTWFVVSQFTDEEYFKKEIIENDRTGYSIEGFLSLEFSNMIKNSVQVINKEEIFVIEPQAGESEEDFMSRCISKENENYPQEQAIAICSSKWNDKYNIKINKEKMNKQKFERATLEDGTPIWISKMEVGAEVFVIDENMEKSPIFDGEHLLTTGEVVVTIDGKITEIKPKAEAEMAEEKEVIEDEKEEIVEDKMVDEVIEELPTTTIDEQAVLAIIQPKLDEIYKVIAEIKSLIEVEGVSEEVIEDEMKSKFDKQIPSLKKLFSSMR